MSSEAEALPCEGAEALAQGAQRSCGCPIPGSVQGQVGHRGLEHPALWKVSLELDWSWRSFKVPSQTTLSFHDSKGLSFSLLPGSRWHKLHSKAGKKEKERGEILVCLQFTRNNITASMFDLSMKDKPRSPFGKLKDKVKGKKKYDLESASAVIPSSMGGLDMEDDYDIGGKKSKVKGFFLKNKLRKSSLTQSNTSLGSDSTISSASLGLASNVPEVPRSPSRHSSVSMERSDLLPSPKLTHKRAFSDDVSQVSPVLEPKAIQSLKPKNDPVSRSSLCINGSHVYSDEPAPKSPVCAPQSSSIPKRQEEGFGFAPLHSEPQEVPWGVSSFERTQQRDEPRFIPSPPSLALQEELRVSTKAVTLSNHLGRARMEESSRLETKPTQAAAPMVFSTDTTKDKQAEDTKKEEKKAKGGLFHHGGNKNDTGSKGQGEKVASSHGSSVHTGGDERSKSSGWFGSKESPQKPSLEVSPQVETSSDAPHFPPCSPAQFPPAAVAHLASMPSTNPSPALGDDQSGCLSPTNPFLNSLQSNPFFEDLLADQVLNSPSPTRFLSSFPSGPRARESPKPSVPSSLSEWDETFDAFATSRLKPELKKENFFASVAAEGMAFIDDPGAASPTERSVEPPQEKGTKVFEEADAQMGTEIPAALRAWTNFSGLHVGANLVSTTQELPSEPLPGSNVVAVPPRVLADVAPRRFPVLPEPGMEPQGAGGEEDAFDIRTSVYRLQASMRLEASDSRVRLSSDVRERQVVLSPWTGSQGKEEMAATSTAPPPKPPRWFAAMGGGEDGEEEDVELPRSCLSSEPSGPASPSAPTMGVDVAGSELPVSKAGGSAPVDSRARLEARAHELAKGDSSLREEPSEMNETNAAEHFETCPSKFSLDGLGQSGLSPLMGTEWEMASNQEPFPEDLTTSRLNPPSKLDLAQQETFWTALEEQEAADHPVGLSSAPPPQRLAHGESPPQPELAEGDGEGQQELVAGPMGQAGGQGEPCHPTAVAVPAREAERGSPPTGEPGIDFKKADFWKAAGAEERHTQDASAPRNPFAPALSPHTPTNPFVEKPPDPHAVKPISAAVQEVSSEKKQQHRSSLTTALSNGLEKLKTVTTSSVQPVAPSSHLEKADSKKLKDPTILDQSAKYYHLTHDELIELLLQKEKELSKKEEHIHELENYIDQLLVRIMEQSPTLLQIPLGENKAK
uniref:RAB11 family interacting protein 5 n=1 Tax=Amazona collaria TaxID=241587 RepID=A0A8B9J095_9PSIT